MARSVDKLRAALGSTAAAPTFARYATDPVAFAVDVLGLTLWSHQRRALEAVRDNRRTAWRSCHGAGKSVTVGAAVAWWICTRPDSFALVTAPSYRQVRSVDWRTLQGIHRRARQPLGGEMLDVPEAGWRFPDGRQVIGFSAGDAEKFAGFHAPHLLAVVDEASGVEAGIFEALKGALTGNSRLFLVGNPTRTSGEFFDAFTRKAGVYCPLHTSATDVPNVSGAEPPIEGLIDQTLLDEMAADFGPESAVYAVRALGEFPRQAADAVIGLDLVESAKDRWLEVMRDPRAFHLQGRLEVGCDPARFGDDTSAITVRRGKVALVPIELRHADVTAVAQRVAEVVAEHRSSTERAIVRVDVVGVGGGVADLLRREHRATMDVIDVNAGASPASSTYQRVRDELWFKLRDWLRDGGCIPPHPRLEGELTEPTFSYSPAQKIVVEPKEDTRKRLRRSPDCADSLALAVYSPGFVRASFGAEKMPLVRRAF